MPSHSVKQAKVMSAIAHGWRPTGKAANIPVSVAKEFHAADAGHKYGHGMHKGRKAEPGHLARALTESQRKAVFAKKGSY